MKLMKKFIILILFMHLLSSSTCLITKMGTNIVVYEEFEKESQRLDVEAKLTYVNMDTGEKIPLKGEDLKIVVNVTKRDGSSKIYDKLGKTNQLGWVKHTFYLEDVKDYNVVVYYDGSSNFKESIGTVTGSGEYEKTSYVTTLPEGISLVSCLPIMLLIGFLGAAMYASGNNPFGFIDMSAPRGFRMNKNFRKTMLVQSFIGTIASYGVKIAQVATRAAVSKKSDVKEIEGDEEKKEKKEKEEEGSASSKGKVKTAVPQGETSKKENSSEQNQRVSMEDKRNKSTIKEIRPSQSLLDFSFWLNVLGALATGDSMLMVDIAKNISDKKIEREFKKINDKHLTIGSAMEEARKTVKEEKQVRKIYEQVISNDEQKIKKLEKERDKYSPHTEQYRKINEKISNLKNEIKKNKEELNRINYKVENANRLIGKLDEIKKRLKEAGWKEEDINKMSVSILNKMPGDIGKELGKELYGITSKVDDIKYNVSYIINEFNDKVAEVEKKENKTLSDEEKDKILTEVIKEYESHNSKIANHIISNENGINDVIDYEKKQEELSKNASDYNIKGLKQEVKYFEDLEHALRNPEEYEKKKEKLLEIKTKIDDGIASKDELKMYSENKYLVDNFERIDTELEKISPELAKIDNKIQEVEKNSDLTVAEKKEAIEELNEVRNLWIDQSGNVYRVNRQIDYANEGFLQGDVISHVIGGLDPYSNKNYYKDINNGNYDEIEKTYTKILELEEKIGIIKKEQKDMEIFRNNLLKANLSNNIEKKLDGEIRAREEKGATNKEVKSMVGGITAANKLDDKLSDENDERIKRIYEINENEIRKEKKKYENSVETPFETQEESAQRKEPLSRIKIIEKEQQKLKKVSEERKILRDFEMTKKRVEKEKENIIKEREKYQEQSAAYFESKGKKKSDKE